MLSYLQHPVWYFAVILSFAFKPVPYFLPTSGQRIQLALLQVVCLINITHPEGAIASVAPWLQQVGFKAHTPT